MSVVVVAQNHDMVVMGSDSQAFLGNTVSYGAQKIVVKGKWTIGFCGTYKYFNIIKNELEILDSDTIYDITVRIEELLKQRDIGDETKSSELLISDGLKLYYVDCTFCCVELDTNAFAIGCGGNFALGSLEHTINLSPVERVEKALQVAIKLDVDCGGSIWTFVSKRRFEI